MKVEKQGWGWVRSGMYARIHMKRHFFKLDGKSLCGIHDFYQFSKMEEKQPKDDDLKNCTACFNRIFVFMQTELGKVKLGRLTPEV